MKFGRNFTRNQVPEWASSYINYKALKKLVKATAESAKVHGTADTAEFFFSLDRNLEDVDSFYNKKYSDIARRLKLLQDQYGRPADGLTKLDRDEVEESMGALLELRGTLRKLQWYGEVNRRGFVKITKKLDKKVPTVTAQRPYLESKVDLKPFATNLSLAECLNTINDWLSALGDLKSEDDDSSIRSSHSFARVSTKALLNMLQNHVDSVDQAIRTDNAKALAELLQQADRDQDADGVLYQRLLLHLLQRSIVGHSKACITELLESITAVTDSDDVNGRNCIHRLVISSGRNKPNSGTIVATNGSTKEDSDANYIIPAAPPISTPVAPRAKEIDNTSEFGRIERDIKLLAHLLDHLKPQQRSALTARDIYGRTPLHYAAEYGFFVMCEMILSRIQAWNTSHDSQSVDLAFSKDAEGLTPLHFGVIGGHILTTKALLAVGGWRATQACADAVRETLFNAGDALILAVKSNFVEILRLLIDAGVDVNYRDQQGESALHTSARFGYAECAGIILRGTNQQRADLEIMEKTFGWTPLFVASVDGQLNVAKLLVDAGANLIKPDLSGWTAKEHAALRGHLPIARLLDEQITIQTRLMPDLTTKTALPQTANSLTDRRSKDATNGKSAKAAETVKTFGHRYLANESMVFVSLGSMDMRKDIEAVKLDRIPLADAHATQLDTALSVIVSASGATGEPITVDLPVQENVNTDPVIFHTGDPTKVKLLFDIVPTYAGSKDRIVGRGVALLSTVKQNYGSKRMSLQGDVSVPIVASQNLEVIGSVNFNFLIITPFTHPAMSITESQTYWKSMTSTMVIGHRGLGKNVAGRKSLQLGENTIQSFIAAANLGASYVEFGKVSERQLIYRILTAPILDVQLTKDLVPVIYHDFLVSETGIDAPVHTLTLEQFLHISESRTPRSSHPPSPELSNDPASKIRKNSETRKLRSMSVGGTEKRETDDTSERMKHTRDFKKRGFKANSRGHFIQAPFTTLEEMFKKLPLSIGFNIEMKYPMLHESEEQEMDPYAIELNSFVDTVLRTVYELGGQRNVIFSSFNPDICLLLSFKQPSIPVLFLTTGGGESAVGDVRASSLQEAIRFASKWNLLGIVSAVEPLALAPRLVRVVKESGLVCVSYGAGNNEAETVKLQVQEGIDAVIVDSVLAIRKGLTGGDGGDGALRESVGM